MRKPILESAYGRKTARQISTGTNAIPCDLGRLLFNRPTLLRERLSAVNRLCFFSGSSCCQPAPDVLRIARAERGYPVQVRRRLPAASAQHCPPPSMRGSLHATYGSENRFVLDAFSRSRASASRPCRWVRISRLINISVRSSSTRAFCNSITVAASAYRFAGVISNMRPASRLFASRANCLSFTSGRRVFNAMAGRSRANHRCCRDQGGGLGGASAAQAGRPACRRSPPRARRHRRLAAGSLGPLARRLSFSVNV